MSFFPNIAEAQAGMYVADGDGGTTSVDGSNWAKETSVTQLHGPIRNFTMPANNRLTYSGLLPQWFHVNVSVSADCNSNGELVRIGLSKNGNDPEPSLSIDKTFASSSNHYALAFKSMIFLEEDDYVEVFVKSDSATDITVDHFLVFLLETQEVVPLV